MNHRKFFILISLIMTLVVATSCQRSTPPSSVSAELSLAIANRISNQDIKAIAEDQYGQIWIGTFRGLNKYDGTHYHQFFCVDDSTGLPESNITYLYCDSKKRLWVGTTYGLARYNGNDGFERVNIPLKNKNITKILENSKGKILIYNGFEIHEYDEANNALIKRLEKLDPYYTLTSYGTIDDNDLLWISTPQQLRAFRTDNYREACTIKMEGFYPMFASAKDKSHIWMYSNGQLRLFDTHRKTWSALPTTLQHPPVNGDDINCIHSYDATRLLVATRKHGLLMFDYNTGQWLNEADNAFPFSTDGITPTTMFTDSRGNLWLGSDDQGFRVIYKYKDMFNAHETMRRAVGKQSVISVATDTDNNLWVATKHNGLCLYFNTTQQLHTLPINKQQLPGSERGISHLCADRDGSMWIAWTFGVAKCKYADGRLNILKAYNMFMPMELTQDRDGNIWVATAGINVYRISNRTGEMTEKQVYPKTFVFIPSIFQLKSGKMLVSAFAQPIMEVEPQSMEVSQSAMVNHDLDSCIRHNKFIPTKVIEDSKGDLWIGTVTNGLLHYDNQHRRTKRIAGLACSDVSSIETDSKGNLWISTMNGLDKLNPSTGEVRCYDEADGLGGFQFYDRSSCRMKDGTLVFGGTHGLTAFNPERVNTTRPIVLLFQSLKVHNQLVVPSAHAPITESMERAKKINLSCWQNSFSVSFAAIDYSDNKRIHYFYKMEGFDKQWTDAGSNTEAHYSNLPAGSYTFSVKIVANDTNNVIAQRSIQVAVAPMPWNTWWAWLIYIGVAIVLCTAALRLRNRIAEEKRLARKAEEEREQEQRINRMNMSFFANVSHEFRTPLTMISGPVEQLVESQTVSAHDQQLLSIINQSVKRMLRLVNQLLDFNKLENDTLRLCVGRKDIMTELKRIMNIFLINAEEKGLSINCKGMEGSFLTWVDVDKLEKIINNLMSNAMKHTPRGGHIDVEVDVVPQKASTHATSKEQYVKITVADTGKGLPKEELENIFKRYYQLNNQMEGTINWGTGIGLYYARALATLHHGTLMAGNRTDGDTGAIFTLTLPVADDAYPTHERCMPQPNQQSAFPLGNQPLVADKVSEVANDSEDDEEQEQRPRVLVVDDDPEVVHYLRTLLSPQFNVDYRFDAESALKAARDKEPALILCDVVMPSMTGYDLCREVKDDIRLSHIPVVLVTAKTTAEDQVTGLESGADAYVTKPFAPKVLLAIIKTQLVNREKAKSILTNATEADKEVEEILAPQDRQFMNELYKVMEQELANSELDVNRVSELMLMSRTKLYYKVKGLTGENPSVFFKTFKLNRAAALIIEGQHNISEIAYMTGFNTLSHFSTSFKKHFGCTPSEYVKRK